MAKATLANFHLVLLLLLLSISLAWCTQSSSLSNISLGSSLFPTPSRNQSSYWLSLSGNFAFGFYPLTSDTFAVGIWLLETTTKTLVWVANRDDPPLPSTGTSLLLAQNGTLIILNDVAGYKKLISNTTGEAAAWASIGDDGNFILYNSDSKVIWESFNFPTHTLLAGQTLKYNQELVSLASETNPATGRFQLCMTSNGSLVLRPTKPVIEGEDYYWDQPLSGKLLSSYEEVVLHLYPGGELSTLNSTSRIKLNRITPNGSHNTKFNIYRVTVDTDGNFRLYAHSLDNNNEKKVWSAMDDLCKVKGICGDNSYCKVRDDDLSTPTCICPPGFTSLGSEDNQLFQSCKASERNESCTSGSNSTMAHHATMVPVENIKWDDAVYMNSQENDEQCKNACEMNCDCMFAVFDDYRCALVMRNQTLKYGRISYGSDTLRSFFKVESQENTSSLDPQLSTNLTHAEERYPKSGKKWFAGMLVLAIILLVYVAFSGFLFMVSRSRIQRYQEFAADTMKNEVSLRPFTYRELYEATSGFRVELGRGSFGAVYRGTLFGDVEIAVKKLDKVVEEGEKQFRAEMNIIGRTHHKNLVRLLGYCKEGSHRLLVYEFMPNGSLASLIFNAEKSLEWEERARISLGIARGLMYLHEECETQIIHCDIKPSNILLSESWVPKISDFGLSKLLDPDQTRTFTGARGTRGYVAPEWCRNVPITTRVDVYSFGVMLLEIICCRKNLMINVPDNQIILSDWVHECLVSGKLEQLVAPEEVDSGFERRRLERMVMVALWCVQEDPCLRPSMKTLVSMLEGTMDVLVPPHPSH